MIPRHVIQAFNADPGRILSARQLRQLGVHRLTAASWVDQGLAERLLHGIYRQAGAERPDVQCLHLPVRYLDQRAPRERGQTAITGQGALSVRGVPNFKLPCRPLILVDESRRPRDASRPFDVRRVLIDHVEIEMVRGLPVVSPARALADLALLETVPDELLRNGVDSLRNMRAMTLAGALRVWRDLNHPGSRRLAGMTEAGHFDQESEGERRAFREVFMAHPPLPDCQVNLLANLRVDFVFLSAALIIEYHGSHHDTTADHDATRSYALEALGYRIIVVTKSMLRNPAKLAEHIHRIRRQRERQILAGELVRPALPVSQLRRDDLRTLVPMG